MDFFKTVVQQSTISCNCKYLLQQYLNDEYYNSSATLATITMSKNTTNDG